MKLGVFKEPFIGLRYILSLLQTTFMLKRKFAPQLHKKGGAPKTLRSRQYVYELIKDTTTEKQPNIDVILTSFIDGLGNIGEKVSVKPQYAYNNLLLPGLAIYASPENTAKYKESVSESATNVRYSSSNALLMMKTLSRVVLSVVMNKDHPWTIQPWHIRTSFRKCGYIVPDNAITLPDRPIKGPDMSLQDKEFFVTVTINKSEQVKVRCRLHHWSTETVDRIQHVEKFWEHPSEPIYEEFQDVLNEMPKKGSSDKL